MGGAKAPNREPVSGRGVSPHLGTHLTSLLSCTARDIHNCLIKDKHISH
jgi:hypothetical protein